MPANDINLVASKDFDQSPFGKILNWALTYGRYIIVCTEIVVLFAFIFRFSLDRKITDLNEEIDQKSAIVKANMGFELSFRNLQERTNQINTLMQNQDLGVSILNHLQQITPADISFTNFTYNGKTISISAISTSDLSLSYFIRNLKNSTLLEKINLSSISKKIGTGESIFQIDASIKQPAVTNKQV